MGENTGIGVELDAFLKDHAPADVARALVALAAASRRIAAEVRRGALAWPLAAKVGPAHDGVDQKALDVFADEAIHTALAGAGVRALASEERDAPVAIDPDGGLLIAVDPLDGSSNIDANVTIGTVFSVLDAPARAGFEVADFLQPGVKQRAGGFVVYGPHVAFVFTTGKGAHVATLDPATDGFRMTTIGAVIPAESSEFAINASNSRHWPEPVRAYVEDCLAGEEGPRGKDFNMRWIASVVADAYRILARGGVYLYPDDAREGYRDGRMRILYEAAPIAFVVEQAGGVAIDGFHRVMELKPASIHARTPFIFGSNDKVARIARYYHEGNAVGERSPLFGKRGLLRR